MSGAKAKLSLHNSANRLVVSSIQVFLKRGKSSALLLSKMQSIRHLKRVVQIVKRLEQNCLKRLSMRLRRLWNLSSPSLSFNLGAGLQAL
jgi:hypothetical protein